MQHPLCGSSNNMFDFFPGRVLHQFADDPQHDLVRPTTNRRPAAHRDGQATRLSHEPHAAPILQATVADFPAQAAGAELSRGGQASRRHDVLLGGLVHQRPQAFVSVDSSGSDGSGSPDLSISALPKVLRSLQYSMVLSVQYSRPLTIGRTLPVFTSICIMNPAPSWPNARFALGMRTSSKNTWAVFELYAELSRGGLTLMPGCFIGTMISDLLMCGLSSGVGQQADEVGAR